LLLYPDFFQKTKGFEAALLQVFCERHREMVHTNSRFAKGKEPFGALFITTETIVRKLAAAIEPARKWDRPAISDEAELYKRAEKLVKEGEGKKSN
jgi:hypothetical protein